VYWLISSRHFNEFTSVCWNIIALLGRSVGWTKSTYKSFTVLSRNTEFVTCTCSCRSVTLFLLHTLMITYYVHIYKTRCVEFENRLFSNSLKPACPPPFPLRVVYRNRPILCQSCWLSYSHRIKLLWIYSSWSLLENNSSFILNLIPKDLNPSILGIYTWILKC